MFWGVSNYSLRPMGKTYFNILLFPVFFISLGNLYDYNYDDYNNDKYDENYEYYDHYHWDYYTDDNSQKSNDYYGHKNLLAPAAFPPPLTPPPPPTPKPGNNIKHNCLLGTTMW